MSENFIYKFYLKDLYLCDQLIDYYKNNTEYKSHHNGIKKSTDVTLLNYSNNKTIIKYWENLNVGFFKYVKKYKIENFNLTTSKLGTNIQYYTPNIGGFNIWHQERDSCHPNNVYRQLVFMTYLNDVKIGGETEFYWQKLKIKPKKGLTLIWPSDFTHRHRGLTSPEEKYIITGWFDFV